MNMKVAVFQQGFPKIINNNKGQKITPSFISVQKNGNFLVGEEAKDQVCISNFIYFVFIGLVNQVDKFQKHLFFIFNEKLYENIQNTFYGVQRFVGMQFDDPVIKQNSHKLPQNLGKNQNGDVCFIAEDQVFSPQQLCSIIFSELSQQKNAFNYKDVVITVPDYFRDSQRQAIRDAANQANFNVKRVINQSIASLISAEQRFFDTNEDFYAAVYHLGGYTFNISIYHIESGVYEIISNQVDIFSGGEEINNLISQQIIKSLKEQVAQIIVEDNRFLQQVRSAAEKLKCELTYNNAANINIEYFQRDSLIHEYFNYQMTRDQLEDICTEFLKNTLSLCKSCLEESGITKDQISKVILTGGSTKIPLVQKFVADYFGQKICQNFFQPDENKVMGVAIYAQECFQENNAFQIPLNVGIELSNGFVYWMIERSMILPLTVSQILSINYENQKEIPLRIIIGVNPQANQNKLLYQINMINPTSDIKGTIQIKVTFQIQNNYELVVRTKEMTTGVEQEAILNNFYKMSDEEFNMIKEIYMNSCS